MPSEQFQTLQKPVKKPNNPNFSSGPCSKRPGWSLQNLKEDALGRSHRSSIGKSRLKEVIETSKRVLGIPDDYVLGIVPASDTGAVEIALWNLLGARGVDVFSWESFSQDWYKDLKDHLKLDDLRSFEAPYGQLPDLSQTDPDRDTVFVWNGTTSGVKVPNGDWIKDERKGLSICDATSAVFAMDLPWEKLDVVTWSWQKVLGGEGAHGMLALSPKAVERLENFTPENRPLPKIFRLTKGSALTKGIFEGATINTPSMLAVEDVLDALNWTESLGGNDALIKRSQANLQAVSNWVEKSDWAAFLAEHTEIRSSTSICLKIKDPWFLDQTADEQAKIEKALVALLAQEQAAFDIGSYRAAPSGLRLWGGATIETSDMEAVLPWLDWGYAQVKAQRT